MSPGEMARIHAAAFVFPRPWAEREFAALLGQTGVFAVTHASGFAMGRAIAGEAEILTVAVDPQRRRMGIGRLLMTGFAAEAATRGATVMFLEVAATNAPAIGLYLGAGFAETGRRLAYFQHPGGGLIDALVLSKAIRQET